MNAINQQQEWASALKKAQQKTAIDMKVPISVQKKHVKSKLKFLKKKLLEAAEKKDQKEVEKQFKKCIEAKAEQFAIILQEHAANTTKPSRKVVGRLFQEFQKECVQIAVAVDTLLGIKHSL